MKTNSEPMSLSVFFPCFNDAGTIGSLVAAADMVASKYTRDYEIIVVDDGSTDTSRELLRKLQAAYPCLRLVFHEKNAGYGAALRSGITAATKDLIFYTDGDAQYDVLELRKLLAVMQDGIDVVNGYKIGRSDPLHRIVIGDIYLLLMRLFFNFHIRDVDCDFRLMRRQVFDRVALTQNTGAICLELVKKLEMEGFHIAEIPVHHFHRTYGKSQIFNLPRLFRTFINIFRLWYQLIIKHKPKCDSRTQSRTENPTLKLTIGNTIKPSV
jgi:glycosyltransferase involved in cell wall biosynthesis